MTIRSSGCVILSQNQITAVQQYNKRATRQHLSVSSLSARGSIDLRTQTWNCSPLVPEDLRTAVLHHTGRKSCRDPGRKPVYFGRQAGGGVRRGRLELQQVGQEVGRDRAVEVEEQEEPGF